MREPSDPARGDLDPASLDCLKQTRSAVLNVLMGVGAVVALTGILLRGRTEGAWNQAPQRLNEVGFLCLFVIFVASTVMRRALGRRARLRDPRLRRKRFYQAHVLPAIVGAVAAVLGFIHGYLISPRLEIILPFWLTALVLGILAYPRAGELEGLDPPTVLAGDPTE
jgi:hypothetical protein